MADDPYSRLKALAEQGRLLRAIAAHEQLAIAALEPDPEKRLKTVAEFWAALSDIHDYAVLHEA